MYRRLLITLALILPLHGLLPGQVPVDGPYRLAKPSSARTLNYSGDQQTQTVGREADRPLRVRVIDKDGNPVIGYPVGFEVSNIPPGAMHYRLSNHRVLTDEQGIATTRFGLGDKQGTYTIAARIEGTHRHTLELFTIYARDPRWVFFLVIGLVGGLGLFMLGLQSMSRGLQQAAGDGMRTLLSRLTFNRIIAMGVGAFVTMVIQSSSATTVMLVSFVQAGLMKFGQTLGIILGADIGTTITAQLIAFKLTDYALLMVGVGFLVEMTSKKEALRHMGRAILGFGLLFFGMHVMSESMYPLRSYEPFIQALLKLENPLLGILAGMLFTALIQSSSAFVGIIIVLGTQGLLTLEAAIPLLLGANIGTAITAILASIRTSREAQRVALAHTLFKVIGVLLLVWWIKPFAHLTEWVSPHAPQGLEGTELLAAVVPRQIANAHTLFNVALSLAALPFTRVFARFIEWILPDKPVTALRPKRKKYLKNMVLSSPSLALNMAKEEAIRLMETVREMVRLIPSVFIDRNSSQLEKIGRMEEKVNGLRNELQEFLIRITRENIHESRIKEAFQILYTVKEFEEMADVVAVPLRRKAKQWLETELHFSEAGTGEILEYHEKTLQHIAKTIEVFREVNLEEARAMKGRYKEVRSMATVLEQLHYLRLREEVPESISTSEYHLELISALRIISSHCTNVARILLQWSER